jgi:hypothetical protein
MRIVETQALVGRPILKRPNSLFFPTFLPLSPPFSLLILSSFYKDIINMEKGLFKIFGICYSGGIINVGIKADKSVGVKAMYSKGLRCQISRLNALG